MSNKTSTNTEPCGPTGVLKLKAFFIVISAAFRNIRQRQTSAESQDPSFVSPAPTSLTPERAMKMSCLSSLPETYTKPTHHDESVVPLQHTVALTTGGYTALPYEQQHPLVDIKLPIVTYGSLIRFNGGGGQEMVYLCNPTVLQLLPQRSEWTCHQRTMQSHRQSFVCGGYGLQMNCLVNNSIVSAEEGKGRVTICHKCWLQRDWNGLVATERAKKMSEQESNQKSQSLLKRY